MKSLDELFVHFLKDIYYAERQILKALPKMAKVASDDQLRQGLMQHREETQHQVERLQKVFEAIGKRAQGQTCEAINGIIEEGEELIEEGEKGPVMDAGLIACAQAVEHYEMSRYGSLIAWAKLLGKKDAVTQLQETLGGGEEGRRAAQRDRQPVGQQAGEGCLTAVSDRNPCQEAGPPARGPFRVSAPRRAPRRACLSAHAGGSRPRRTPPIAGRRSPPRSPPRRDARAGSA